MYSSQPSSHVPTRPLAANIAELAESRLRVSAYLALRSISCAFEGGSLVLRGYVPTYYLKQVAQQLASQVDRAASVNNQIEVAEAPCGYFYG